MEEILIPCSFRVNAPQHFELTRVATSRCENLTQHLNWAVFFTVSLVIMQAVVAKETGSGQGVGVLAIRRYTPTNTIIFYQAPQNSAKLLQVSLYASPLPPLQQVFVSVLTQ